MKVRARARKLVNQTLSGVGLELHRIRPDPRDLFLGLRKLPVRTIFDIGANVGQFARTISAAFPEARVHSFEPQPGPYAELAKWASTQGGRVDAHRLALGDHEGTIEMNVHVDFSPSSSILKTTELEHSLWPQTRRQSQVSVPLTTLDAFVAREGIALEPEVIVKLDVQGYEDRAIRGAARTLAHARACIVEVCLDALFEGQPTFGGILATLEAQGLKYAGNLDQAQHSDGHVMYLDAVFVR